MGDDGTLVDCDYQSGGGLVVTDVFGVVTDHLPVTLLKTEPVTVRDGLLCFWQREPTIGWRIYDLAARGDRPLLARQDGVDWMVPFRWQGDVWVLERDYAAALTIRRATAGTAVTLVPGPTELTFNPDMRSYGSDAVVVAWSENIQESADALRKVWLNVGDLARLPTVETAGRRVPAPAPIAAPVLPAVPDLGEMWAGFVTDQGMPVPYVGTCAWTEDPRLPADLPCAEAVGLGYVVRRPLAFGLVTTGDGMLDQHPEYLAVVIAATLARGASALAIHWDDEAHPILRYADEVRAAGLRPIVFCHAVDSLPAFVRQLGVVADHNLELGVTWNIQTVGGRSRQGMADVAAAIPWARVTAVFVNRWKACAWPELQAHVVAAVATARRPTGFSIGRPDPAAVPPLIIEPVTPAPTPPPVSPASGRGHGGAGDTKSDQAVAIAAGAGGIAGFAIWLWRRLRGKKPADG